MKFTLTSNQSREIQINWQVIKAYVSRWKPDTEFDIEIKRKQAKHSDPMRKYYFSTVLPPFMDELGYERDEHLLFHHQLKATYFQNDSDYKIYQDERGIWRNVPSVFGNDSDMDISVKKQFVDWVVRKAAHYDVYIPDPGEAR